MIVWRCVVSRRECGQESADITSGEGRCDLHYSREQKLRAHSGDRDIEQFLEAVLDTLDSASLVAGLINALEACTQRKEACAKGHPHLYDDYAHENVSCVGQPLLRAVDETKADENGVQEAVGIAGEDELPCCVDVTSKGRSIENVCKYSFQRAGHLIDEPSQQEARDVADRAGDDSEYKRILDSNKENVVLKEQSIEVAESYPTAGTEPC